MANTTSPTFRLEESARVKTGRPLASIFNTAISVVESAPITVALNFFLSRVNSSMSDAPDTHGRL
jgi:hypothetical protein